MSMVRTSPLVTLEQVRHDVDAILARFFDEHLLAATDVDPSYEKLWATMQRMYRAGGKRIRPYLVMLAYEGAGGTEAAGVMRVAAGVELLHMAMLIHDDIIDRDYTRHGQQNIAGTYKKTYHAAPHTTHYAHGAALLAGDLALSGAYQLILSSSLPAGQRVLAGQLLSQTIFTVTGGQLLDMEGVMQPVTSVNSLKIAALKTASYSFVSPLTVGARLAGAEQSVLLALTRYGEALGVAFQLADDILGLFGDEAVTGKSSKSDIAEGKPTYMMQRALALSDELVRTELSAILGSKNLTDANVHWTREVVIATGAKREAEQLIETYAATALQAIANTGLTPDVHNALVALIALATRRDA
jgi:geranylgeranyl diphosphate synthase type II